MVNITKILHGKQNHGVENKLWLKTSWWLLGLAVKESWLGLGGPPLALSAWTGLETLLSPCRGLVSGKEGDMHMVAVRTWRTEVDARTSPEI